MNGIKKNIVYNLIYQILTIILPFITAPYLSRVIGAAGVGNYAFSHSMALYFTYITQLGLTNYGNRTIAAAQNDFNKRSQLFCEIYIMQIICFCFSILGYGIYVFFFSKDYISACIMTFTVFSSLFDINWFFFGMEQFKLTVIRNSIIKIATVVCIFLFVKSKEDIYIYIAIMSLGTFASQVCLWPFMKKFIKICIPKWHDIKKHFKPNLILFIPAISVSIYKIMDKLFLGYISTLDQVGYYENAERIITITVTVITAVGTVMLPRITALLTDGKVETSRRFIDITMMFVIAYTNAVVFGIFSVAKEFVVVYYGDGFVQTGILMCYLAVTVVFLGCGNVVRTQYLIPMKQDSIYIKSAIIGAVVNVIINSALIPDFEAVGAAIGTICAEFAVCGYQIVSIRKNINIVKYLRWEIVFASIGTIMYVFIYFMPGFESEIVNLIIHVCLGAVVYTVLSIVYIYKREGIKIGRRDGFT